jgi:hypothetical protein
VLLQVIAPRKTQIRNDYNEKGPSETSVFRRP